MIRIPFYQFHVNMGRLKPCLDNVMGQIFAEVLTGEDVEVRIPRFVTEMTGDVRGFNKLDESVAGFIAGPEMLDKGFPIGFHVNLFNQVIAEPLNV